MQELFTVDALGVSNTPRLRHIEALNAQSAGHLIFRQHNPCWAERSVIVVKVHRGRWSYRNAVLAGKVGTTGAWASFEVPSHYMLQSRFQMSPLSTFSFGFRTQETEAAGYHLTIRAASGEVELSGPGFKYARPCRVDTTKPVKAQAFVQGSIIECFVNDAHAFTCRAYDFPSGQLSLSAVGGDVQITEMTLRVPNRMR